MNLLSFSPKILFLRKYNACHSAAKPQPKGIWVRLLVTKPVSGFGYVYRHFKTVADGRIPIRASLPINDKRKTLLKKQNFTHLQYSSQFIIPLRAGQKIPHIIAAWFFIHLCCLCLIELVWAQTTTPAANSESTGKASSDSTISNPEDFVLTNEEIEAVPNPFLDQLPPEPGKDVVTKGPPPTPLPELTKENPTTVSKPPPTVSAETKPMEMVVPNFTINGLVWDTDRPQAIVNNNVVGIGDEVEHFLITNITSAGIDVISQGRQYRVLYKY